jgi:hypothetical protein
LALEQCIFDAYPVHDVDVSSNDQTLQENQSLGSGVGMPYVLFLWRNQNAVVIGSNQVE